MGEMITFPSNGSEASGYLAIPPGGGPGLVVMHPQAAALAWMRTLEFLRGRLA